MFALLKDLDWTIGEFFHHLFSHKDEDNISISRSQSHGLIVQNFLAGKTNYTVSYIIDLWMTSLYGSGTTSAFRDRNPVPRYPAGSTGTNSLCRPSKLRLSRIGVKDRCETVDTDADAQDEEEETAIQWMDLGNAVPRAAAHFREIQRAAFHFLSVMAEPTPRSRNGVITIRKSRPRENVSCSIVLLSRCNLIVTFRLLRTVSRFSTFARMIEPVSSHFVAVFSLSHPAFLLTSL
jgi:hypothetical protein